MTSHYAQAKETWDGIMGKAVRSLLCLNNEAGAWLWFQDAYTALLEERDQIAREKNRATFNFKINAGMVAKRMLEIKMGEYKGRCSPGQYWNRV